MNTTARKAREAHRLVNSGVSWEKVANQLGYASGKSAREAVRTYANQYGWQWPLKKTSRRSRGRPILGYSSHPEAAYRLRETGLLWSEVGEKMGLFSENAHRIAQRNARKYALRHDLVWPPKLPKKDLPLPEGGEDSYNMRVAGTSWGEIGNTTGLGKKARSRAQRYAEIKGKSWPIKDNDPSPMEQAYHLRIENPKMSWNKIAEEVGYSHSNHACTGATRYWTSKAVADLTQGRSHETRISSRCPPHNAGSQIILDPVDPDAAIKNGKIALVEIKGNHLLKKISKVHRDGTVSLQGKGLSKINREYISGIVR